MDIIVGATDVLGATDVEGLDDGAADVEGAADVDGAREVDGASVKRGRGVVGHAHFCRANRFVSVQGSTKNPGPGEAGPTGLAGSFTVTQNR